MSLRARTVATVALVIAALFVTAPEASADACGGLTPTVTGTEGNDTLTGTTGDDIIVGLGGNDSIDGMGGNDALCGGPGDDTLTTVAGEGPATITLDAGLGQDNVFLSLGSASTDPSPQGSGTLQVSIAADGGDKVTVEAKPPGGVVGDPAPLSASINWLVLNLDPVDEANANRSEPILSSISGNIQVETAMDVTIDGQGIPNPHHMALERMALTWAQDIHARYMEIHGGKGADRITGTPQNDRIFGNGSGDRIDGGGGDRNELDGGTGTDRCGRGFFMDGMFGNCELRLNGDPLGGPIRAELEPPKTFYGVAFAGDTGGSKFNYDWSATTISCGRFKRIRGQPPNTMQWVHPNGKLPKRCPHKSASHPGKIKVTVKGSTGNSRWVVKCTYSGSLPGEGPACQIVS